MRMKFDSYAHDRCMVVYIDAPAKEGNRRLKVSLSSQTNKEIKEILISMYVCPTT